MGWREADDDDDLTVERGEEEINDDDGTVGSDQGGFGGGCVLSFNNSGTTTSTTNQELRDRFYSTIGTTSSTDGGEDFKDSSSMPSVDWEDTNSIHPQAQPEIPRQQHSQSSSTSLLSERSFPMVDGRKEDASPREGEKLHGEETLDLDLMAEIGEASVKCDTGDDKEAPGVGNKARGGSPLHTGLCPNTPQRSLTPKQANTNKTRDFLEKYRRGGAGLHHNSTTFINNSSTKNNNNSNNNSIISKSPPIRALPSTSTPPNLSLHPTPQTPLVSNLEKLKGTDLVFFDATANSPDQEGYILNDELLADSRDTPLLVFVNTRSGSQQGLILKVQLRRLLNPIQVWDLADGGPEKVLESFSVLTHLRLLVCGGDGTVSWIISALDKMQIERWPPIAILPLGTGNDLARIHGWGAGYANESLLLILNQVQEAYISLLDRWKVTIEGKNKKRNIKALTNYMSIGMDALSALQVHNLRENSPKLFFSRAVNKIWYAIFGMEEFIKSSYSNLPQQVTIEADGVEVPIPDDSQGLIILNIDSYLGGVPIWSRGVPAYNTNSRRLQRRRYSESDFSVYESAATLKKEGAGSFDCPDSVVGDNKTRDDTQSIGENFACRDGDEIERKRKLAKVTACVMPSSCQDGHLDVISIRGNFHLGQIRVGLSNAQLLCQCRKLKITLKKKTAAQIDGEPWEQDKGTLQLVRKKDPAIMLHRATEEGGGVETEVAKLLDWAEENTIINHVAHETLMREFSRRIESKTRARRVKSQKTVFSSMTRLSSYIDDG